MFRCSLSPPTAGPGPTQEELRRRVENGVKEFWYFVRSEVKKLVNVDPSERQKYADTLLQDLGHQERWADIKLTTQNKEVTEGKMLQQGYQENKTCGQVDSSHFHTFTVLMRCLAVLHIKVPHWSWGSLLTLL